LDIAVGSGSVEMTKYLLEFHGAQPTRETLRNAISTGNLELFRMMRERLLEAELRDRFDLLEVAAEFHQEEVCVWLFRDSTIFERELLAVFALEGKLADMLLMSYENGLAPWWYHTREVSLNWRASKELGFVPAPEGFLVEGGWWKSKGGGESGLPPLGPGGGGVWVLPGSVKRMGLTYAVLPAGVTTIGKYAFRECSIVTPLGFPSTVTAIGGLAFWHCSGLTRVEIPSSVTTIGEGAFDGCSDLTQLKIASSVAVIGKGAFRGCTGLTQLRVPPSVTTIGAFAFSGCSGLTLAELPSSVTTIGDYGFDHCSGLTRLEIPSSVTTIGHGSFADCSGLGGLRSH
jgi:hypothetical protein